MITKKHNLNDVQIPSEWMNETCIYSSKTRPSTHGPMKFSSYPMDYLMIDLDVMFMYKSSP